MKLQEIKEGEPIVITVKNEEDAEIEYRAQVLFCKQDILFIDPIRVNDRLVSFKGENLRIMVTDVPKDEMCLIGDTMFDVEGANQVGIRTVAVTFGFGDVEQMVKAGAVAICEDMAKLPEIVAAL